VPVPAVVADHVEPHHGDSIRFYLGKLQSLCRRCHDLKTAGEKRGYSTEVGIDGMPVDPRHPCFVGRLPPPPQSTPPETLVDDWLGSMGLTGNVAGNNPASPVTPTRAERPKPQDRPDRSNRDEDFESLCGNWLIGAWSEMTTTHASDTCYEGAGFHGSLLFSVVVVMILAHQSLHSKSDTSTR
jgi:hypothetical protein